MLIAPFCGAARVKAEAALPTDFACRRCALCAGRTQVVAGKGPLPARLMIVGEAPGAQEDKEGAPFVGRAGAVLDKALAKAGVERNRVYIANVVKCRPPENRRPKPEEMAACAPFLAWEIEHASPGAILALGATAAQALLGGPTKVVGEPLKPRAVEIAGATRAVFVTLHPAASRFQRGAVDTIAAAIAAAWAFASK